MFRYVQIQCNIIHIWNVLLHLTALKTIKTYLYDSILK
jgi:hypothetical protein